MPSSCSELYGWLYNGSRVTTYCIWIGGTSTSWNTNGNWIKSTGSGYPTASKPSSTYNVFIPSGSSNQPAIAAATVASALDLTINSGATLTNNATNASAGYLDIYGNFTNNGTHNHVGDAYVYMKGTTKILGGTGTFTTTEIDLFLGSSTTLSSNLTLLTLLLGNSAATTLNLSYYYITISGDFWQEGTINFNTGTMEVQGLVVNGVAAWWNCNTGLFYENLGFSGTWMTGYTFYDLKINCPGFTYSLQVQLMLQEI